MNGLSTTAGYGHEAFRPDADGATALYGLPNDVDFCRSCVISNQRPNSAVEFGHTSKTKKSTIRIDDEGVCDACRVAEQKRTAIDWAEREKELWDLCDRYRRNDGAYDCLVPGSGGKDSFYASHILKHKFRMNPLTVTWAPHIYTDWGWKNFQAWIHAGFDNFLFTPNGQVHRLLTRIALEQLFHPFQPFMLGQKNIAPRLALKDRIPLVFYGENEAEYGNPATSNSSARQDSRYFSAGEKQELYLSGVPVGELKSEYGLDDVDLAPYLPVPSHQIEEQAIESHYLGYYLKWHPQSCYYYAVEHSGFQAAPERTTGTYSKYASIDDKIDDLHYYTTFIKFGIGRATYDASQEIRSGEITRQEGVALVKRFDGEFPERFLDEILAYLSIDPKTLQVASGMFEQPTIDRPYFLDLCDRFRSPHLWMNDNGEWKLRHTVWQAD